MNFSLTLNVTGCDKSQFPRTQQQDTLFNRHQMIALLIDLQFREVLMLKVDWATFAVACF